MLYLNGYKPPEKEVITPEEMKIFKEKVFNSHMEAFSQCNVKNASVDSFGSFYARETTFFMPQLFTQKYAELKFRQALPINNQGGFMQKLQTKIYNFTGDSQTQSENSNNIPLVDAFVTERESPIIEEVLGMKWDYSELQMVQQYQPYLEQVKLMAIRRGLEQKLNTLALYGNTKVGTTGLLNDLTITRITAAATGTGGSTRWVDKTPALRMLDIFNGYTTLNTNANGVFTSNNIYMSLRSYNQMITPRSDFSDYTVQKYSEVNLPDLQAILPDAFLNGVGAPGTGMGGSDVMIFMDKNAENFFMNVAVEMLPTPPVYSGVQLTLPYLTRSAGFVLIRSPSILIMEGL